MAGRADQLNNRSASPPHRLSHRIGIAALGARQGLQRLHDDLVDVIFHVEVIGGALGNADEINLRIVEQFTLSIHRDPDKGAAGVNVHEPLAATMAVPSAPPLSYTVIVSPAVPVPAICGVESVVVPPAGMVVP